MHTSRNVLGTTALILSLSSTPALTQTEEPPKETSGTSEKHEPVDTSWRRPLSSRNQFPVLLMFVSLAPDNADTLAAGGTALDIGLDYSNIISGQESEEEFLLLDLEYLRTTVALRHGLPNEFELGVSIPFYVYYGGFLDPFVAGFHESLGLPNFLRGMTENGQSRYELITRDGTPFFAQESTTAVGDVTIHAKKTLYDNHRYAVAVRSDLKLPTGRPDRLSGSGATDVGVGAAFQRITARWGIFANASYHFLGQPESFESKDFFSFMVGADWRFKPRLTAHIQYEHARPFVVSELPIFNEAAEQLALGLRWRYSDRFVYEWRFVEDFSDVSPDFTVAFEVGIRWQPTHDEDDSR